MTEDDCDDLAQLSKLDETEILNKLRDRYAKDKIYTKCGEILIAINPYKNLQIFDVEHHNQYDWRKFDGKAKPHIFHVATRAYQRMRENATNQVILVSGESGAGKTESTKLMVKHFIHMCPHGSEDLHDRVVKHHNQYDWRKFDGKAKPHIFHVATRAYQRMRENATNQVILVSGESGAGKTESTKLMVKHFIHMCPHGSEDLHDRVVKVNPLLEAFGNAQTIMNQNSSRFAKYLELSFQEDGQVFRAVVRDYMLEKSRVVNYSYDEGNFHIFYSLFAGAPPEQLAELSLTKAKDYKILNKGSSHLLEKTEEYKQMYLNNMSVLKQIGFTQEDFAILHCMLGAILHITQVEFKEAEKQNEPLEIVHIEQVDLGEAIHKLKNLDQARDGRDALAKAIYERLFGWVIRTINKNLSPTVDQRHTRLACIGVLDIAGFENLHQNSFEQLCINFVNEELQNFMNEKVFKHEKLIYEEEGIPCTDVNFTNNSVILEIFNKNNIGILPLLDEETKLQGGTDKNFVFKVTSNHSDSDIVVKCRANDPEFGINHFAGKVWYTCKGFLEKNRDMVNDDLLDCMKDSSNPFIQDLFKVHKGPTGTISDNQFNLRKSQKRLGGGNGKILSEDAKKLTGKLRTSVKGYKMTRGFEESFSFKKHATVLSYFRESMNNLKSKLKNAEAHFVRCIKPNSSKQKDNFNDTLIKEQLLYNGITEIAKIRKQGFPIRSLHQDFYKRYHVLNSYFSNKTVQTGKSAQVLLDKLLPEHLKTECRVGKYKVFLKEPAHMHLEKLLYHRKQRSEKIIAEWLSQWIEKKRKRKEMEELEAQRQKEQEKELTEASPRPASSTQPSSISLENSVNSSSPGQSRCDDKGPAGKCVSIKGIHESTKPKDEVKASKPQSASRVPDPPVEDQRKKNKKNTKKEKKYWDVFSTIARETKTKDVHERRTLRIIKVMMYGLFFLIMLFALVSQKISLMLLVHSQNRTFSKLGIDNNYTKEAYKKDEGIYNSSRYLLLLVAMCIPYALTLIMSILKWLFGNAPTPNNKTLFLSIVMEVLHCVGLSLLVFKYLKEVHAARGIMILSATCILPSVLKTFCFVFAKCNQKQTEKTIYKDIAFFFFDFMAAVFQISCIPLMIKLYFLVEEDNPVEDTKVIVGVTFCLLLCSFSWWENFIDDQSFGNTQSKFQQWIFEMKYDLQKSRPVITMVTSFIKILMTGVMAYVLNKDLNLDPFSVVESIPRLKYENYLAFDYESRNNLTRSFVDIDTYDQVKDFTAIICITIGSYIAYYVSYTACKLQMQKISFSLAVLFSTPVAVLLVELDCYYDILEAFTKEELYCIVYESYDKDHWYHFVLGLLWLMSTYWIARYIWCPHQEKLAKMERLFVNPFYCSVLLEQHLLMNRKRQTKSILKTFDNENVTYKLSQDQITTSSDNDETQSEKIAPMLYACATMWHETKQEMVQLLKSLFRVDSDQFVREQSLKVAQAEAPEGTIIDSEKYDYYKFQAHIMFDDAFEVDEKGDMVPNEYVKKLIENMQEAANAIYKREVRLSPPQILPSPYGAQLVFEMPGENLMYVHLKDKNKIRHRKRWSQVMYMYYLLGYRIMNECRERVLSTPVDSDRDQNNEIEKEKRRIAMEDKIRHTAANTFILALDGDVDFTPKAVRLLMDKMIKNEDVAASCGRIHPIGKGPVVWYQKFEYAVAHWLQKATEHVLGCVLCSPGCFSLFRGSALIADNIMNKYTHKATEASHYLMYDQGYRIMNECRERVLSTPVDSDRDQNNEIEKEKRRIAMEDKIRHTAANTFILALDGDVDFTPKAVRLLMDKMIKNEDVAASCGRIHPIGKGPVVWYQKFEYAVAHWLQKATEHVLGCVLCSPGCFSLFRGSALIADNIMNKYTHKATEASHYLMYDQGEDRWLCNLLLQQGYRVDYVAASDAYTYVPEGFGEFFNQRRRWMPSTVANITDLLTDAENTVGINKNISWLYIIYQGALMVSTLIGPATVIMMIAGAYLTVFRLDLLSSYAIALAPAIIYVILCFKMKAKYQIMVAELFSALYAFIMMIVFVGSIITAAQESPFHPSVIFLASMVFIFVFAAILHPWEWTCIIFGALYFLCVPSGFLLLVIYSLVNLHDISWGTREIPKKLTKEQIAEEDRKKKEKEEKKKQGWFGSFIPRFQLKDLKGVLDFSKSEQRNENMIGLLEQINKNMEILIANTSKNSDLNETKKVTFEESGGAKPKKKVSFAVTEEETLKKELEDTDKDDKKNKKAKNKWTYNRDFRHGHVIEMNEHEYDFWKDSIEEYLEPIELSEDDKKKTSNELKELRNNVVAGFCFINLIWIAINFMFQLRKPAVITFPIKTGVDKDDIDEDIIKIDALGLMFVIFFVLILLIQFTGMVMHRWGTFMHLIVHTEIPNPLGKNKDTERERKKNQIKPKDILRFCQEIVNEPMPDYPSDDEDDDREEKRIKIIQDKIQNFSIHGVGEKISRNSGWLGRTGGTDIPSGLRSTLQDQNFKKNLSSRIAMSKCENRDLDVNQSEFQTNGLRNRTNGEQPGITSPWRSGPGNVSVVFKDVEKKFKERHPNQPKPEGNLGACSNHNDDIYDEIPAETGTLSRNFQKKLLNLKKQRVDHDNNTLSSGRFSIEDYNEENDIHSRPISEEVTTQL